MSNATLKDLETCPECGTTNIDLREKRGESICNECYTVTSIEDSSKTEFEEDEEGLNRNYLVSLVFSNLDISNLERSKKRVIKDHTEEATNKIYNISKELNLKSEEHRRASELYYKAYSSDFPIKKIETITAVCVFYSAREAGNPVLADEVAELIESPKKKILQYSRRMSKEMGLKPIVMSPRDYLKYHSGKLELSEEVINRAKRILTETEGWWGTGGNSPHAVSGGAIYLAAQLENVEMTQDDVAEVAKVSQLTIRNNYQELKNQIGEN